MCVCFVKHLKQLEERSNSQVPLRLAWDAAEGGSAEHIHYNRFPPQSQAFFQPLGVNPNLQMGYIYITLLFVFDNHNDQFCPFIYIE